ncbi:MAG: serine/threonine protein kinase [Nannocystaceae bacterium]|nr:serine/threonine protein kinase [Nannocystaceae bacterium]
MNDETPQPADTDTTSSDRGIEYARVKSMVRGTLFGRDTTPLRLGRFTVLERLGQGGMSIVYAAYDDQLDRKIALKLLRPEGACKHQAPQRLRREAQAIARLSHPNVIPVYEVGEHDGQVFLAMEFVRGVTLRSWLDDRPRPWSEVSEVLLQAARGLAAAHRAGIVHRDFKPDNVMVDDDGRVRVLDFGVAALELNVTADTLLESRPVDAKLTYDGALVGTPVYMAPECLARESASPSSDQFSFCAVCFEALAGRRHRTGNTVEKLKASGRAGASFSSDVDAPAPVRTAILRGLQATPAERHVDMDGLISALEPRHRRRWVLPVVGFAATAGIAAWGFASNSDACKSGENEMREIWSGPVKSRVHDALVAESSSVSLREWDAATGALDTYAERWGAAHASTCDADGPDAEVSLEQALCFQWLQRDLGAVVATLGQRPTLSAVPMTVDELDDPQACTDPHRLRELVELRRRKSTPAPVGLDAGLLSNFEEGPLTRFGAGWSPSTDVLAGGQSIGEMEVAQGGKDSAHALRLHGEVRGSQARQWSGAMVFLGEQHFAPANLQRVETLSFWARGTPGQYAVMVFTLRDGFTPGLQAFELDEPWQHVQVKLADLAPERYDVTGVFIGRIQPGVFDMRMDDVRFD